MSMLESAFTQPGFRWNEVRARHLLNRAGFGVPVSAVKRLASMPPDRAVAAFVDYEGAPDTLPPPDDLPETPDFRTLRQTMEGTTEEQRQAMRRQRAREDREAVQRLQRWWLERMCRSQRPLEEKMTLFWHGHFVTSAEKVRDPRQNLEMNRVLRTNATGSFRRLLAEVARCPAMLRYLDNMQSTRTRPNENWARELLELFTLGIGNYTEEDILAAARAFTGWTVRGNAFFLNPRQHDSATKTFLGRTGPLDGEDVMARILEQPACARHVCGRLWRFFAYDDPEPEIVEGLAATLRDADYQMKPVLRRLFSSRAFFSDRAVFSQIKSPAQLTVNLHMMLDVPLPERPPVAQLAMRAMGQDLLYPPNVKGWDGGRAWINTDTLLVRTNYAGHLVSGTAPGLGGRGGGRVAPALTMRADEEPPTMRDAPAGQDAMSSDIPGRTLAAALRRGRGEEQANRAMRRAAFDARAFFARCEGMTAPEMADYLTAYFIGHPLDASARSTIAEALAPGRDPALPLAVTTLAEENLRGAVQLLLGMAEFQLC